jgi:hypothetical protein
MAKTPAPPPSRGIISEEGIPIIEWIKKIFKSK